MVLISSPPASDEAMAATYILNIKIRHEVLGVAKGICILGNHKADLPDIAVAAARAQAAVVLLAAGSLESLPQLTVIIQVMATHLETKALSPAAIAKASLPGVIPVALPGFMFPDVNYYTDVLHCIWPSEALCAEEAVRA